MIPKTSAAICALLGVIILAAAEPGFSEGPCGATFTAENGGSFTCGPTRVPYCQQSTRRCQCLERKACGGAQDESW